MAGSGRRTGFPLFFPCSVDPTAAYRKTIANATLYDLPEPKEGEEIVRVIQSHGSNIFEVQPAIGIPALCRLPSKFRKMIWIKRGKPEFRFMLR
jgi:hypothetical protein